MGQSARRLASGQWLRPISARRSSHDVRIEISRVAPVRELRACGTSAAVLLCLVLLAEARHDAEQQNDSRPRMLCLTIGIGSATCSRTGSCCRQSHRNAQTHGGRYLHDLTRPRSLQPFADEWSKQTGTCRAYRICRRSFRWCPDRSNGRGPSRSPPCVARRPC